MVPPTGIHNFHTPSVRWPPYTALPTSIDRIPFIQYGQLPKVWPVYACWCFCFFQILHYKWRPAVATCTWMFLLPAVSCRLHLYNIFIIILLCFTPMTHHWSSPREFNMHIKKIWWGIIYSLPVRQFNTNLVQKYYHHTKGPQLPHGQVPCDEALLKTKRYGSYIFIYGDGTFLFQKGSWISPPNVRFQ